MSAGAYLRRRAIRPLDWGWRGDRRSEHRARGGGCPKASSGTPRRVIPRYVFDTGALISAERGKERASRFLQLVHAGRARILVPLPVVAEWWRGRRDIREEILAATEIVASVPAAKAAGVALGRMKNVHARLHHRRPGDCDCRACRRRRHHGRSAQTSTAPAPHFPGVVVRLPRRSAQVEGLAT